MEIKSNVLLENLRNKTQAIILQVKRMNSKGVKVLNRKPSEDAWSALECLEHLNRYGRFYIPEMKHRIDSSNKSVSPIFKSGKLGNYFAKSMIPRSKMKKINTFKSMNPNGSKLDMAVVEEFVNQQEQILDILDSAKNVDLTKTKTGTSLSSLVKLRLGDTLRVVIYHNERHVVQAQRAMQA